MKNILTIILLSPLLLFSQEEIGSYEIFGTEYKVQATEPDSKGKYTLYVDGYASDGLVSQGGLMIQSKKIDDFLISLNEAKNKFIEWTATAKENNISDLSKDIKSSPPKIEGYFLYGDWNFDFSVSPYYKYLISKSEKTGKVSYCLSLYSGELQASDNQYIDAEDFIYPFYSLEEIEIFISLFDKQLVDDKFNSKNSKDDLFKD